MHTKLSIAVAILITITFTAAITTQPNQTNTTQTTTTPTNGTITYEKNTITFSGYNWKVRNSPDAPSTPGPNYWSNSTGNLWVDSNSWLHLKITCRDGKWYCPEVYTLQALGYGTYVFHTASPVDSLDRNIVLGLFTYQDDSHEVDIEYSRWGQDDGFNSGFTVQPAPYTPNNSVDFDTHLTGKEVTHVFTWRSDKVIFKTVQGNYYGTDTPTENLIKTWESKVSCDPTGAKAVINLWLYHGLPPSDLQEVEVVVTGFEFIPL
jgi:hypothetical protein